MAFGYAGRWGPEIFLDAQQNLMRVKAISVYNKGTLVLATLYTDRTKATPAANPFNTDGFGNGTFFADPGEYDIAYGGQSYVISVPMDSIEAQGDGPPTGPAGGDLAGLFPNPTIKATVALSGSPTSPTPPAGNNSLRIANTAFVLNEIALLIASAPGLLNTLDEIAAALGDDPAFATTMTTLINDRVRITGHTANSVQVSLGASIADLPMPASTMLARLAAGNVVAATPAQIRTLLDFAAQVALVRLDQMAVPTGSVAMNAQKLTGVGNATAAQDALTKAQFDANDPAWTAAPLVGDWTMIATYLPLRYRKVRDNVQIEGNAKGTSGTTTFTLPAGFRPTGAMIANIVTTGGTGFASISTAGVVVLSALTGSTVGGTFTDRIEFSIL